MHNRRLLTSVEKIIISAIVMFIIIVAMGVVYVLYTDSHPAVIAKKSQPTVKPVQPIKPTQPAANAKEGAAVETILSPVPPGSNSAITVSTNPKSYCTISLKYKTGVSKDSGLAPRTADDYGQVTWTWTVGKNVPPGKYPISVLCKWHGKSAVVDNELVVSKP